MRLMFFTRTIEDSKGLKFFFITARSAENKHYRARRDLRAFFFEVFVTLKNFLCTLRSL